MSEVTKRIASLKRLLPNGIKHCRFKPGDIIRLRDGYHTLYKDPKQTPWVAMVLASFEVDEHGCPVTIKSHEGNSREVSQTYVGIRMGPGEDLIIAFEGVAENKGMGFNKVSPDDVNVSPDGTELLPTSAPSWAFELVEPAPSQ